MRERGAQLNDEELERLAKDEDLQFGKSGELIEAEADGKGKRHIRLMEFYEATELDKLVDKPDSDSTNSPQLPAVV